MTFAIRRDLEKTKNKAENYCKQGGKAALFASEMSELESLNKIRYIICIYC